jgi:hypothetical protein
VEDYEPYFDEETGEYLDKCPYEKYTRGQQAVYTCRCISGRTMNNRQQFVQHFKTKAHTNWLKHLGKDENIKLIKELRIELGKKDNMFRLQARHLKRSLRNSEMLEKEIGENKKSNESILRYKNELIAELQENIKLLEKTTGCNIEYLDENNENALDAWDLSTIESDSDEDNNSGVSS